jgi:hypothetical protein
MKPEPLAYYKRNGLTVWMTFIPMDDSTPYEIETSTGHGGDGRKHRYDCQARADEVFRAIVRKHLIKATV